MQQRSDMQEQQLQAGVKPSLVNWCPAPAVPDGLLHTEINGEVVRKETTSSPGNYMGYYDDVYKALTTQMPNPYQLPMVLISCGSLRQRWRVLLLVKLFHSNL